MTSPVTWFRITNVVVPLGLAAAKYFFGTTKVGKVDLVCVVLITGVLYIISWWENDPRFQWYFKTNWRAQYKVVMSCVVGAKECDVSNEIIPPIRGTVCVPHETPHPIRETVPTPALQQPILGARDEGYSGTVTGSTPLPTYYSNIAANEMHDGSTVNDHRGDAILERPTPQALRRRNLMACIACRRRKIKCEFEEGQDSCTYCRSKGHKCRSLSVAEEEALKAWGTTDELLMSMTNAEFTSLVSRLLYDYPGGSNARVVPSSLQDRSENLDDTSNHGHRATPSPNNNSDHNGDGNLSSTAPGYT